MWRFIGAIFIVIFITGAAFASEIRQMNYFYPYEFAKNLAEPAFVVCDNCPPRKSPDTAPKIVPTVIALRVSQPIPVKPEPLKVDEQKEKHNELREEALTDASLTVYFNLNSSALRPEEKEKLNTAPSLFKGDVVVTGYTCDIGSEEYNRRLSLKRAGAVAEYLKLVGVAPREITGKGKCCPISDKKELNRRVEIKEAR